MPTYSSPVPQRVVGRPSSNQLGGKTVAGHGIANQGRGKGSRGLGGGMGKGVGGFKRQR